jgi:hypothetical protein
MKVIDLILPVFFRAMVKGYTDEDSERGTIFELPGYKTHEHIEGDFRVLDCYSDTPQSNSSSGFTTVWNQGTPVWVMQYDGTYEEEAIPFLKWVLMQTYKKSKFVGGRGAPVTKKENGSIFTYSNYVEAPNWRAFRGREEIQCHRGNHSKILGSHRYSGRLLLRI